MTQLQKRSDDNRSLLRYYAIQTLWGVVWGVARSASAAFHMGNIHFAYGKEEKAVAWWQKAVSRNPKLTRAWNNMVQSLLSREKWQEAEEGLLALHRLQPEAPEYVMHYARCLTKQGQMQELEAWYHQQLEGPHATWAAEQYGVLLLRGKRFEEARSILEQAVEEHRQHAGIWKQLGSCYIQVKQYRKALQAFEKSLALKSDPKIEAMVAKLNKQLKKQA